MNIKVNSQENKVSKTQDTAVTEDIAAVVEPNEDKEFKDFLKEDQAEQTEKTTQPQKAETLDNLELISKNNKNNIDLLNMNYLKMQQSFLDMNKFKMTETNNEFLVNFKDVDEKDIDFFKACTEKQNFMVNTNAQTNSQLNLQIPTEGGISYKSIDVSKGLFDLIDKASQTNKPVRLSFDNDSSVILKVNKDGLLSASFISNDKAMEQALKANLPFLKNKMDNENIPYKEISYGNRNKDNNKRDNKGDNKDE